MNNIFNNRRIYRYCNILFMSISLISATIAAYLFIKPIDELENTGNMSKTMVVSEAVEAGFSSETNIDYKEIEKVFFSGLFKSNSNIQSKPVADKTIESIKSKLQLQCVMTIAGQKMAYIKIKDLGLKKCKTGDAVENMFSVLDIQNNSVDIAIIGHKLTLTFSWH